jgi:hypothetical protein
MSRLPLIASAIAAAAAVTTASPQGRADESAPNRAVLLHVSSSSTVSVARDDTGEIVCSSPCDKRVPDDVRYRIVGDRPSEPFVLTPGEFGHAAVVKVNSARNGKFWLGIGALGLSAGLITGGVATLLYAMAHRSPIPGSDGESTDTAYTDRMTVGTTLLLVGTVAGIWGTATVISNAHTSVRGDVREAKRFEGPRPRSIALPQPTLSLPILGGTF